MKPKSQCPLCSEELELREVAPCMYCGGYPEELNHFHEGQHTYAELEIFPNYKLVLCDFCQVDFGSHDPEFYGFHRSKKIGYEYMKHTFKVVPLSIGQDKYCTSCQLRLKYLDFVAAIRKENGK